AGDEVALAQREPSYLRRGHVHVLLRGQVAAAAQEAVALGAEVEQAFDRDRLALGLGDAGVAPRLVLAAPTAPTAPTPAVALAERLPLVLGVDAVGATVVVAFLARAVVGRGRLGLGCRCGLGLGERRDVGVGRGRDRRVVRDRCVGGGRRVGGR